MDKKEKTLMWSLLFLYSVSGKMADEKVRQRVSQTQLDPEEDVNGSTHSSSGSQDEQDLEVTCQALQLLL